MILSWEEKQSNMENAFILLGGNILNSGIAHYCKKNQYPLIVVDWSPSAHLKGDLFLCIDVKDTNTIIQALNDNHIENIAGAFSSIDLAVPSVNRINKYYGLCSMDQVALKNAHSKAEMTRVWQDHGLLNRFSKQYITYDKEIYDIARIEKIIIKPNVSSSSRGITIVDKCIQEEEVMEAFKKAQDESFDHTVIVEEFVDGQEFTCEMLGDNHGNVSVYAISVKYHTKNTENNKIAVKLHYNSEIYPNSVYEKIATVGKKCFQALGFHASFGHLEIIMKKDGSLTPIEIGARSSGFITNPLVSEASEKDYLGDYLDVLHGGKITGDNYINGEQSSMYFFYDMPSNTSCRRPCTLTDFLPTEIKSLYFNREKILHKGYAYHNINNDNERIGYEILSGPRRALTITAIQNAENNFIHLNTNGIL